VVHGESEVVEDAFEDVVGEEGAEVSDVGVVVDGGAAGVHGNVSGGYREEGGFGSGQGVVEFDLGRVCGGGGGVVCLGLVAVVVVSSGRRW